jgi:hypothetical protein
MRLTFGGKHVLKGRGSHLRMWKLGTKRDGSPASFFVRLFVLFLTTFAVGNQSPANAVEVPKYPSPKTTDDLAKIFGIGGGSIDFTLVVDTSSSMRDRPAGDPTYPKVVSAFRELVGLMQPSDYLTVLTFNSSNTVEWSARVGDGTKASSVLPLSADGEWTDIGKSIEGAVTAAGRPGGASVQVVIVLTDGEHVPDPTKTRYPSTTGASWDSLRTEADAAHRGRKFVVLGVGLGQGKRTDIDLVSSVFPEAETVDIPPEQLGGLFQTVLARGRDGLLATPIAEEARDGFIEHNIATTGTLKTNPRVRLRYTSYMPKLDCSIQVDDIEVTNQAGEVVPAHLVSRPFVATLRPGQSANVDVQLDINIAPGPREFGQSRESRSYAIAVKREKATLEPTKAIRENITGTEVPECRITTANDTVKLSRTIGISWNVIYMIATGLLLLFLLFCWVIYKLFATPPLVGQLVSLAPRPKGVAVQPLQLKGKRMMLPGAFAMVGSEGSKAELFTRPRKWRKVFVRRIDGVVRVEKTDAALTGTLLGDQKQLQLGTARLVHQKKPTKL